VEGSEQLTLLPLVRDTAAVAGALAAGSSVVTYKAGRRLGALRAVLEAAWALERAIYAEHLGTPDERVAPLAEVDLAVAPYLSTVLVPPRRGGRGEQL
jgi:precorrin-2/cobalt-factor-2 C20-methyltransferase